MKDLGEGISFNFNDAFIIHLSILIIKFAKEPSSTDQLNRFLIRNLLNCCLTPSCPNSMYSKFVLSDESKRETRDIPSASNSFKTDFAHHSSRYKLMFLNLIASIANTIQPSKTCTTTFHKLLYRLLKLTQFDLHYARPDATPLPRVLP